MQQKLQNPFRVLSLPPFRQFDSLNHEADFSDVIYGYSSKTFNCPQPFKRQLHKMVKHTQTFRRQQPTNCLSVFDLIML